MSLYAEVILGLPLTQPFTYIVPESYQSIAQVGTRVRVPFQRRSLTGFIIGLRKRRKTREYDLKEIQDVLDGKPVFSSDFLSFTRELSEYHFSSWGELLHSSLPSSYLPKSRSRYFLTERGELSLQDDSLPEDERLVLNLLQKGSYTRTHIKRKTKTTSLSSLLSRLEKKGFIQVKTEMGRSVQRRKQTVLSPPVQLEMDFSIDRESLQAVDFISRSIEKEVFSPFYIHAPQTKREAVYFDLIQRVLDVQKRVLFLVPEISLTQTLLDKFEKRLGKRAALLHSQLTEKGRETQWERVREGQADVVLGPRSALFSPLTDVGLVILDEEHDDSYYQRESPSYDARKGAWMRAKNASSVLVYGSSMPSVEAYHKAKRGGYLISLQERSWKRKVEFAGGKATGGLLEDRLIQKIEEKIERKESVLVFYNRRGYVSFLVCPRCRFIPRCTRCDVALRYHKKEGRLLCHYCGYSKVKPEVCPECGNRFGLGQSFGIEVVEEELRKRLPRRCVVSFDSDAVRTKKDQERILTGFKKKKIDILLGTQLLARQTGLPPVSLVIVLHPEILLTLPDFRASQKTFQAVSQMAKFLNPEKDSELFIQTSVPDHYSIRCAAFEDYQSFFGQEINYRQIMNYPPFACVAEVLFTGENLRNLARESRNYSSLVKKMEADIEIWGPALASVARVRGRYRVQVVLKSKKKRTLARVLRESLFAVKSRKAVFLYD
jgi:primosomal protein N' (replication factor Y)